MHHIALFGPPGAGKGTRPEYLVKHLNRVTAKNAHGYPRSGKTRYRVVLS